MSCQNASHVSRLNDVAEVDSMIFFQGRSRMLPGAGNFGLHSIVELGETPILMKLSQTLLFPRPATLTLLSSDIIGRGTYSL